ncbi:Uncharacterised protein [Mycolicibacterium phlei]|uniref:hypothetical protein n=1 Tax=Mycobacteroides chelonae TaxID=1774 RepID=UPI000618BE8E|nr:hypothetical protein [Mycobacteroides chelonae]VEG18000.1 Uncharacterised protein [Mycolicibacterium phlei]AKC39527.1 hypothetical protein GR01_14515 [Mycobacteroides chelonae]ANB00940.1 hypothetical protein BB28_15360 [Mycobacteroides chelonae CCUG 47445]OLT72742.1 hypothetical protein BKG56_22445 [Mycobacteroides chelonae]ORV12069.1 hypothetical protein AWB96_22370 [Mycobacteroides chelonae]
MKPRWRVAFDLAAGVCWLVAFAVAVVYGASWWRWIVAVIALIAGASTVLNWHEILRRPIRPESECPRSAAFWWVMGLYLFGVFFLALPSLVANTTDSMNWVYLGFCLYGVQQYSCDADEWWRNRRTSARETA